MLNMLGRIMWIAVGALGVKAVDAAMENKRAKANGKPRSTRRRASGSTAS